MPVIIIGNKTGKGNGKKIISYSSEETISAVRELSERFNKIRISSADTWYCEACGRKQTTKSSQKSCGLCGAGRKEITEKSLDAALKDMFGE